MRIDFDNCQVGNRAIASVLVLYYHLLREGGITHDQTTFVDADDFDAFAFVDVEVADDVSPEIDQALLREGSAVYLLCDLNDCVAEFGDDYLAQPLMRRIIEACERGALAAVPEAGEIVALVRRGDPALDAAELAHRLDAVYDRYVVARMRDIVRMAWWPAASASSWPAAVDNPQHIAAFYPDASGLGSLSLHAVTVHRDGPCLRISGDLERFPDAPSSRWPAGTNRARVELACWGVRDLALDGVAPTPAGTLGIERVGDALVVAFSSPRVRIRATCESVRVERITGYVATEPWPA